MTTATYSSWSRCNVSVTFDVTTSNATTYQLHVTQLHYSSKNSNGKRRHTLTFDIRSGGGTVYSNLGSYNKDTGGSTETWAKDVYVNLTKEHSTWPVYAYITLRDYLSGDTWTAYLQLSTVPVKTSYAVKYYANSGSGTTAAQTKWHNESLALRGNGFTRSGFAFKRWNTNASDAGGTAYNAGATYTGNAALNLYAIWNHTVTYNANGGTGAPGSQTAVATSAIALSSTVPKRSGYTFAGWYGDAGGSGSQITTLAANAASATVYAKWNAAVEAVTIGTPKAIRTDDATSTTESDEGAYAYLVVPYTVTGAAAASVAFAATCSDKDGNPVTIISGGTGSANKYEDDTLSGEFVVRAGGSLATDESYLFDISITATNTTVTQADKVAERSVTLAPAYFTMDVLAGGHGVSFGAPAKDEVFKVAMPFEQGSGTIAASDDQAVFGRFNIEDANGGYALIVGNGESENERSNAFGVKWNGGVNQFVGGDYSVVPNESHYGDVLHAYDGNWNEVGYMQIVNTSTQVYRSFAVRNPKVATNNVCGLYVNVDDSGNRSVWLTSGVAWPIGSGGTGTTGTTYESTISSVVSAASGTTITEVQYAEWGKVANIAIKMKRNAAISSGDITNITLCTVASGKRPRTYVPMNSITGPVMLGYINTAGSVILHATSGTLAANTEFWMVGTYVLA